MSTTSVREPWLLWSLTSHIHYNAGKEWRRESEGGSFDFKPSGGFATFQAEFSARQDSREGGDDDGFAGVKPGPACPITLHCEQFVHWLKVDNDRGGASLPLISSVMAVTHLYHLHTLLSIVRLTLVGPEDCIQSARLSPMQALNTEKNQPFSSANLQLN